MVVVHLKSGQVVRVERATSVTVEEEATGTLMTLTGTGGGARQATLRCRAADGAVVEPATRHLPPEVAERDRPQRGVHRSAFP